MRKRYPSTGQIRRKSIKCVPSMLAAGLAALAFDARVAAQTVLPQGGRVTSGQASINSSSNALTITQQSNRAVIDWNSFSVGANNAVSFAQPSASSAILNRVDGSTTTTIAGSLSSNGQLFLVNPNGIYITPTGTVQAGGGFVASTLSISNQDFSNGNYNFNGAGASATVNNSGSIATGPGGYVALLGGSVSSSGSVDAYLGKVGIASGEQIILNPNGDGFLQVAVPTTAINPSSGALIDVSGKIKANGGSIEIQAASAQNAAREVINVSGRLSARSVSGSQGNIVLGGGAGGNVIVSGKIAAKGGATQRGGTVAITGNTVALHSASIDVSGGTGGGTINIGGGAKGAGPLQSAVATSVDASSLLRADATVAGNGGAVTVWSSGTTTFGGFISAQGGPQGGNGGSAEVSGAQTLTLNGDYTKLPLANLSAPLGKTGNLLFDPGTVNILDQTTLASGTALNGPDTFTAQFISSQLATANVTISTNNATGANGTTGDINLLSNAQIAWASNNQLTLEAARNINFSSGSSITGSGASSAVVLQSGTTGDGVGTVNFAGPGVQVSANTVNLYYNPASNRTAANGGSNNAAGTVNATSYTGTPASENWTTFISATALKAWMLVNNVFDLQNIQNALSGNFALGTDVDASATSGWNGGSGFVPLGTNGSGTVLNAGQGFTGTLDGLGHTISTLTINRGASDHVGMFGYTSAANIQNLSLSNVSVTGGSAGTGGSGSGALVGVADNGTVIRDVSVSGTMNGSAAAGSNWNLGGIVGELYHSSSLLSSSANVNVTSALHSSGGAVGAIEAGSTVANTSSSGSVAGTGSTGGLAGYSDGTITSSYATGPVGGGQNVGGLVGNNNSGTIVQSYASGTASGSGNVGGLAGSNGGSITTSYAYGSSLGTSLVSTNIGGLVGQNSGSIDQSYSAGPVAVTPLWGLFGIDVGGFVGYNTGTITSSYFDTTTSQRILGVGLNLNLFGPVNVSALTTAQAMTQSSYAGWDFTNTWWMQDGQTRPFLQSEYSTTISNAHQLQLINMSNATLDATYTLRGAIDMSETSSGTGMWGTSGFVPIGTDGNVTILNGGNGFAGSINGSGGAISNLYIDRPTATNVGLFGYVGSAGTLTNIALAGANVTGQGAATCCNFGVGTLAGWNNGSISDASASGSVEGNWNVGGLVGQNEGTISKSNSSVTVLANGPYAAGGLVGWNILTGTINESSASGVVNANSVIYVGGLVGTNEASVSNSYATGATTGSSVVSSLIGWNTGNVTTSYGVGVVSGSLNVGGLIGQNAGTVTSSYFDNMTTGTLNPVGTGIATGIAGLSTSSMQNGSLPAGFSSSIWSATLGQYPTLSPGSTTIRITGTSAAGGSLTYGDATPSLGYSVTDTLGNVLCTTNCAAYFSGAPVVATNATPTANAGTMAYVYAASGTVAAVAGYVIDYVNSAITIAQKALTITASNQSKSYGTVANLGTSAFTTAGLVNTDSVSSVTLTSAGSPASASVAGSPYAIVPSAATGTGLSNYAISYVNGVLTVGSVQVNVTALGGSSTYGSSPANPGLSATGLQNGQTASVLTGLSNSFGITNLTNAGSYTTNVAGTLTNPNYTIGTLTSGTWTVNPATVNVTALGGSSTYGASPVNPGLSATGLQNGQTVAVLTGLSNSFGITNLTNAGGYATNVAGTLTNSNYVIGSLNSGIWTVNPAAVVVTALGGSSIYGSSPTNPGLSATGLQNGQTVRALTGLANSFGITNLSNAGVYTTSVAGTLTNPNYVVSAPVSGAWIVNPAPLTVTALGGSSNVGDSPANPGLSATGLQNGQTTSVLTGLSNSFGISSTTAPGTYAMMVNGVLTNSNYVVTGTQSKSWSVFPPGQTAPQTSAPDVTGSISSTGSIIGGLDTKVVTGQDGDVSTGLRLSTGVAPRSASSAMTSILPNAPASSVATNTEPQLTLPESRGLSAMASAGPAAAENADEDGGCEMGLGGAAGGHGRTNGHGRKTGAGSGKECGNAAPANIFDFAYDEVSRSAVFSSVASAFDEVVETGRKHIVVVKDVTVGASLVATAGIIGWLLRGGALLSAFLTTAPLWRQVDPLAVVMRPRRRGDAEGLEAEVDAIFDGARSPAAVTRG